MRRSVYLPCLCLPGDSRRQWAGPKQRLGIRRRQQPGNTRSASAVPPGHNTFACEAPAWCAQMRASRLGLARTRRPGRRERAVRSWRRPLARRAPNRFISLMNSRLQIVFDASAGSAREAAEAGDSTQASLAPALAAKIYGLDVLESDVEDEAHNATRFILLVPEELRLPPGPQVVPGFFVRVRNLPAALYKARRVRHQRGEYDQARVLLGRWGVHRNTVLCQGRRPPTTLGWPAHWRSWPSSPANCSCLASIRRRRSWSRATVSGRDLFSGHLW